MQVIVKLGSTTPHIALEISLAENQLQDETTQERKPAYAVHTTYEAADEVNSVMEKSNLVAFYI